MSFHGKSRTDDSERWRSRIDQFESLLFAGKGPRIEDVPPVEVEDQPALLEELVHREIEYRCKRDDSFGVTEYLERFPLLAHDPQCVARLQRTYAAFVRQPAPNLNPQFAPTVVPAITARREPSLAGRSLLFGIVALQNNFITREQLVAAFDAWVQDKSRYLGRILVATEALSGDEYDVLTRLVAKFLEKHGGDPERSLAALSSVPQVRPELERLADEDLVTSLGHVGKAVASDSSLQTILYKQDLAGRFRILRPHAKGGLGQVSVALDQELNREVALKEILVQHSDDTTARERFVLEAEITGGLEHPGIVPVYALGQSADGRPFYAMRFVKGDSLKQAIEDFHNTDNPNRKDSGTRQLALRQLLGRFIDVCQAIEYAHSRGVLHRDLKPGNVMVGKYGETLVVDWGLAKALGKREVGSDDATLRPSSALSSSMQTQAGSAIGTPAYMSPEQAAGKLDDVGPATDVYSLGATLYQLLCGRPPFDKEDLAVILRKVQKGEFARPRTVLPEIPHGLEAICLKAMQLRPEDRYPSARALADDVEHWLADEPLTAAEETVSERFGRWGRKHKVFVQVGGSSLVVIATVAMVAASWINGQNNVIAQQKRAVELAEFEAKVEKVAKDKAIAAEKMARAAELTAQQSLIAVQVAKDKAVAAETKARAAEVAARQSLIARGEALAERALAMKGEQVANEKADLSQEVAREAVEGVRIAKAEAVAAKKERDLAIQLARRSQYGAHMNLAQVAWENAHVGETVRLLGMYDPAEVAEGGSIDFRGFEWFYWDRKCRCEQLTLKGHTGEVSSVAFNPNGHDAMTLKGHTEPVRCVAFSPNGQRLALANADKTVKVWDAATGQDVLTLKGHIEPVNSITYSPDGQRLASASHDQTVKVWDAVTGRELLTLKGHTEPVFSVAFRPDGQRLASASRDQTVKVWDAANGQELLMLKGHTESVNSVTYSPDGARLASASHDQTVKVWDAADGHELLTLEGHTESVKCVTYSPDGARLASASHDHSMKLWDATTGQELLTLAGHTESVNSVTFSPDGARLASASHDRTVKVWDAANGHELLTLKGHMEPVTSVAFSPDGKRLASGSLDKTVKVWDATTGPVVQTLKGHANWGTSVAFSSNGQRLASGSWDKTIKVWDATTGREMLTVKGHTSGVNSVAFGPDGQRLASASHDLTVRLWDPTTGEQLMKLSGHIEPVNSVAFSPDGQRLASGSWDTMVKLWDASSGQDVLTLRGHAEGVTSVAFSPNGNRLASASEDQTVKLWDVASGRELLTLKGHTKAVNSVTFSPDGQRLASASSDKTVKFWDAATGQELLTLKGHTKAVNSVTFSPDGKRLASASLDKTVKFWDVTAGQAVLTLKGHAGEVASVAFSPNGQRLASASSDKTVRLWDVTD